MKTLDSPEQIAELTAPTLESDATSFDRLGHKSWGERILGMVDDSERLGSGSQKDVYVLGDNPDRAVAVFNNSEQPYRDRDPKLTLKRQYYARKILHALYPENIPDVYLAASEPAVLITERINPGIVSDKQQERWKHRQPHDQERLGDKLRKIGVYIDQASPLNFVRRPNGSLVYVDDPMVEHWGFSAESIAALHEEVAKLPRIQRVRVERQIRRWNALMDEEDGLHGVGLA